MIEIEYNPEKSSLTVFGHAHYGEKGKDIVCAAVSSLVCTVAQAVELLYKDGILKDRPKTELSDGNAFIEWSAADDKKLIATAATDYTIRGLERIAGEYPDYVRFIWVG